GGAERREKVIGKCLLNLLEIISGRLPHLEEWIWLDTGGQLKISIDYDTAGTLPVPGDRVRL
ncbi:unnamed protein product, partial [Choristocarpus tenellus]